MSVLSISGAVSAGFVLHALTATLLGLAVWVACRFVRHAPTRHALWLVVLLKLVTPPWVEVAILPAVDAPIATRALGGPAFELIPLASAPANTPAPERAKNDPRDTAFAALLLVLASGSLVSFVVAAVRLTRFRRWTAITTSPPPSLTRRLDAVAQRMGMRRSPPLRLVDAHLSPALWPTWRGAVLLFPRPLVARLDDAQIDTVFAHELAHLRRRDHWVRFVELAATIVYWWHPLTWVARRELRRAEERACDGQVAAALPGSAKAYATGLLETLTLLTLEAPRRPVEALPATATGMNTRDDLEERLTMIITERTPTLLSPVRRGLIAAVALATIAVVPIRADRDAPSKDTARDETVARDEAAARENAIARHEAAKRELERQAMAIESEKVALEDRQMALEARAASLAHEAKLAELEHQAEALRTRGDHEKAEALGLRRALLEKEYELRAQQQSLVREARDRARALERERREVYQREATAALERAKQDRSRLREQAEIEQEYRARARALQAEALALRQEVRQRERAAASSMRKSAIDRQERILFEDVAGRTDGLRAELEAQILALEAEREHADADLEADIEAELEALHDRLDAMKDAQAPRRP